VVLICALPTVSNTFLAVLSKMPALVKLASNAVFVIAVGGDIGGAKLDV
jgi:hypothetical protein